MASEKADDPFKIDPNNFECSHYHNRRVHPSVHKPDVVKKIINNTC